MHIKKFSWCRRSSKRSEKSKTSPQNVSLKTFNTQDLLQDVFLKNGIVSHYNTELH